MMVNTMTCLCLVALTACHHQRPVSGTQKSTQLANTHKSTQLKATKEPDVPAGEVVEPAGGTENTEHGADSGAASVTGKKKSQHPLVAALGKETLVSGNLSIREIQTVIGQQQIALLSCFGPLGTAHREQPVIVRFIISGTGSVQMATILYSAMDGSDLENCIVAEVQRWLFPAPQQGGAVIVTHPFYADDIKGTDSNIDRSDE